ncbi:MAG: PHP domain-containing protein [Gemmatimonadetes bacterium]|nr:PHP domain-containing protein [Gemmatimonadota bacterium]
MKGRLRIDLHSHTCYSPDARTTPAQLIERAAEIGIDRVAVTDHGEIEGALRAQALDPERIIVGEEVRCRCRTELIGLFLTDRIPEGLPIESVVERIRDQGGLVYAPHPWAYLVRPGLHARRAIQSADIVEVFNSRAFWGRWNRLAAQSAAEFDRVAASSSDAHFPHEIGRAWTAVPAFGGPEELLQALRGAEIVARRSASPVVHIASVSWRAARRVPLLPRIPREETAPILGR